MKGVMKLIKKERKVPIYLQKLEVLLRRLDPTHPKYNLISGELLKSKAGYNGEKSVDYYLSFLLHNKYQIYHDVRLRGQGYYFQIDTLILSPFFILLIEVKNLGGTLYFDQHYQMIRTINGKEEGYPHPLLQVERQQLQLEKWLSAHKMSPIPIECLVVISNPATIIKTSVASIDITEKVIHMANIPMIIKKLENLYKLGKYNDKELRKLSSLIISEHQPGTYDILNQFHIEEADLCKGIHCPNCSKLFMVRKKRSWYCPACAFSSKNAHLDALKDYRLLLGTTINNRQFRDFCQFPSKSVASKILISSGLPYSGKSSARNYHLQGEYL